MQSTYSQPSSLPAVGQPGGYKAAYAPLVFASQKEHDSFPEVGDVPAFVGHKLFQLASQHPGQVVSKEAR